MLIWELWVPTVDKCLHFLNARKEISTIGMHLPTKHVGALQMIRKNKIKFLLKEEITNAVASDHAGH